MKDKNGLNVRVGDRVCILDNDAGLAGRFGTVWKIDLIPGRPQGTGVKASDAKADTLEAHQADDCTWMAWLQSHQFAVVTRDVEEKK